MSFFSYSLTYTHLTYAELKGKKVWTHHIDWFLKLYSDCGQGNTCQIVNKYSLIENYCILFNTASQHFGIKVVYSSLFPVCFCLCCCCNKCWINKVYLILSEESSSSLTKLNNKMIKMLLWLLFRDWTCLHVVEQHVTS